MEQFTNADPGNQVDTMQFAYDFGAPLPTQVPVPLFFMVICMPFRPPDKSAGGVLLADVTKDNSIHLNAFGRVVAIGASAFKSKRLWPGMTEEEIAAAPKPQIGDWVTWGRFVGSQYMYAGFHLVRLPEDALLEIVPHPELMRVNI